MSLDIETKLRLIDIIEKYGCLINGAIREDSLGEWCYWVSPAHTIVLFRGTFDECKQFRDEAYKFTDQIEVARQELKLEGYRRLGVDI